MKGFARGVDPNLNRQVFRTLSIGQKKIAQAEQRFMSLLKNEMQQGRRSSLCWFIGQYNSMAKQFNSLGIRVLAQLFETHQPQENIKFRGYPQPLRAVALVLTDNLFLCPERHRWVFTIAASHIHAYTSGSPDPLFKGAIRYLLRALDGSCLGNMENLARHIRPAVNFVSVLREPEVRAQLDAPAPLLGVEALKERIAIARGNVS